MRQSKLNFNRENRNNGIGYADRNKHFNDPESHSFIKQKKRKQVKPCSRHTEKPCGYRVEVPQHHGTSQQLP